MRIFHGDMSEGRHCHGDLGAPHKELETEKHSPLVKACGRGQLSPTGKGLRDGTGHCQRSLGLLANPHPFLHSPATSCVWSRCPEARLPASALRGVSPAVFCCHKTSSAKGGAFILDAPTVVTVKDAAARTGESLVLHFSAAGSGERGRVPFGFWPCFALPLSQAPRPVT